MQQHIQDSLEVALHPDFLTVQDDSKKHAGHTGMDGEGGTHFAIFVVSKAFEGLSRVKRHQNIYAPLKKAFEGRLHALSIRALTPEEFEAEA